MKMNNELTITNHNGAHVVDSRDVALSVGKQHFNLIRDIKGYVEILGNAGKLNFDVSDFFIESTYLSEQNKELPCYLLTKEGCNMVAHKITGKKGTLFTATYVLRFKEMEEALSQQPTQIIPFTRKELILMALEAEEKVERLEAENQVMLPKAETYDQFMCGDNTQLIGDVAKTLGIGPRKLFTALQEKNILMSGNKQKHNMPYQLYIDHGYFVVINKPVSNKDGVVMFNTFQTRVTARGVEFLSKFVSSL